MFTNWAWAPHFVAIFPINIPGVLRLHYTSFIKISSRIGPPEDCNVSPGGSNVHNYAQAPKPIHMAGCEYRTVRPPSTWESGVDLLHWTEGYRYGIPGRATCCPRPTVVKVTDTWIVVFQRKLFQHINNNVFTHRIHGAGIYIYANIWGILMGSMLPYIAAPWILWVIPSMSLWFALFTIIGPRLW